MAHVQPKCSPSAAKVWPNAGLIKCCLINTTYCFERSNSIQSFASAAGLKRAFAVPAVAVHLFAAASAEDGANCTARPWRRRAGDHETTAASTAGRGRHHRGGGARAGAAGQRRRSSGQGTTIADIINSATAIKATTADRDWHLG